jgi:PPP family 3-phenylpropionic acid transporter
MPYWRLSSFYLFYFASLGALLPYWPLYLDGLGFTPAAIGELMAALMATKIVAPNVWGWIADHSGRHMPVVRLASLASVIAFSGVLLGQGYAWLMAVMLVFSFFWNAALPQLEATTLRHLGDRTHRYSIVRLWGSIGFILTVALLGELLEGRGPAVVPLVVLGLMAGIWVSSLWVPAAQAPDLSLEHQPIARTLRQPQVLGLLAVCFLMQASHGPYYTFFTIYLREHHYTSGTIGWLWALGVIAEVCVFLVMHRLVPWCGLRGLLLGSLGLTVLRWLLIGWFVDAPAVMAGAQLLHAASFGVYHATAIQLVHRFFSGRQLGRGQALYSSMSFGAGGAVGSLYSGYLWAAAGPLLTYVVAAGTALLAWLVAWRWIRV